MTELNKEIQRLQKTDFSIPTSVDDALKRINRFVIHFQDICMYLLVLWFICSIYYKPQFIWVISMAPIPFVVYKMLQVNKQINNKTSIQIEDNEVFIVCGMVSAFTAYIVGQLPLLLRSMIIPGVIIIRVGRFYDCH